MASNGILPEQNNKGDTNPGQGPAVKVVVRCRPLSEREIADGHESIVEFESSKKLTVNSVRDQPASNTGDRHQYGRVYEFDAVFDGNSQQEDIYKQVCAPIVASTLEGYNGTIFAYGQTGTGKTYTLEGPGGRLRAAAVARRKSSITSNTTAGPQQPPKSAKQNKTISSSKRASVAVPSVSMLESGLDGDKKLAGVIPRAFVQIFEHINKQPEVQFLIRASYLQLYQEELHDLLRSDQSIKLELHERPDTGVYVKDLTSVVCKSISEIERVMRVGNKNRAVGATDMNEYSSRSHAIFMITIEQQLKEATSNSNNNNNSGSASKTCNNVIRVGKLNLIDLAGSERQRKTNSLGERQRESVKINLSLSALGNVINSLMKVQRQQVQTTESPLQQQPLHVPYRDSKLTRLMQDSLGGNAKTLMIAHIGPASYNYDETINTLNYASRAKLIRNKPRLNEDPKDALLRQLKREIDELRSKLASMGFSKTVELTTNHHGSSDATKPAPRRQVDGTTLPEANLDGNVEQELDELRKKLASLESKLLNSGDLQPADGASKTTGARQQQQHQQEATATAKQTSRMFNHELLQAHTQKQELELEKSRAELVDQKKRERAIREQLERDKEIELATKESFSSIQQELDAKKRLIRQILVKVGELREKSNTIQVTQRQELDELDQLQYNLIKELKLKSLIMDNFIPNEHVGQLLPRIQFDDRSSSCCVKPLDDLPTEYLQDTAECQFKTFYLAASNNPDSFCPKYSDLLQLNEPLYHHEHQHQPHGCRPIRPISEFERVEQTISPANIRFKHDNLIETRLTRPASLTKELQPKHLDTDEDEDDVDNDSGKSSRLPSSIQRMIDAALAQREPDIVI